MLIYLQAITCVMEARRDVFQAIADPTRRAIIGMLASQSVNVNTIAEQFNVSRQAISLHLKILTECGLVVVQPVGRERICQAKLDKLGEVHNWVLQYQHLWSQQLHSLKKFLETKSPTATSPKSVLHKTGNKTKKLKK